LLRRHAGSGGARAIGAAGIVRLRAGQLRARPSSVLELRQKGRAAARARPVRAGDYSFKPRVLLALHEVSRGGNRSSVRGCEPRARGKTVACEIAPPNDTSRSIEGAAGSLTDETVARRRRRPRHDDVYSSYRRLSDVMAIGAAVEARAGCRPKAHALPSGASARQEKLVSAATNAADAASPDLRHGRWAQIRAAIWASAGKAPSDGRAWTPAFSRRKPTCGRPTLLCPVT
jgi:hypothetical protein